jgi:tetratricopeptide (TPR) repeat protein
VPIIRHDIQVHVTQSGTVDDVLVRTSKGWMRFDTLLVEQYDATNHSPTAAAAKRPDSCWMDPANEHLTRGDGYYGRKDYDSAIKAYDLAIRFNPYANGTFNQRAIAYRAKRQYDQAMADYNQAAKLNPTSPLVYSSRCYGSVLMGRGPDAIADCDKSLVLSSRSAQALDARGYAYFVLGQYQQAIADFNEALATNPRLSYALYGRGLAKLKMRDKSASNDIAAAKKIYSGIADEVAQDGLKP